MKTSHPPLATAQGIKALEQEIESLRSDRDAAERMIHIIWDALNELPGSILSNEAGDLTQPLIPVSYQTAICHKHPEAAEWFEEEEE